jgi:hypothetical protein
MGAVSYSSLVAYSSATCALEHRTLVAPAQYLVFLKG